MLRNYGKHGRGIVAGDAISAKRSRFGHEVAGAGAIGVAPLADVGGLRAERKRVNGCTIGREQTDGFARFVLREFGIRLR